MKYVRTGAWRKIGGTPQFSGDRPAPAFEAIVIAHRAGCRMRWNGGGKAAFWEAPVQRKDRVHATQKPDLLLGQLMLDFTDAGDLVCDPFAGSGSTGCAAVKWGRRFLGFELDAEMAEKAESRILCQAPVVEDAAEWNRLHEKTPWRRRQLEIPGTESDAGKQGG